MLIGNDCAHTSRGVFELLRIFRAWPGHQVNNALPRLGGGAERDRADIAPHPHCAISFWAFSDCLNAASILPLVSLLGSFAVSTSDPIATKISLRMRRPSSPSAAFASRPASASSA